MTEKQTQEDIGVTVLNSVYVCSAAGQSVRKFKLNQLFDHTNSSGLHWKASGRHEPDPFNPSKIINEKPFTSVGQCHRSALVSSGADATLEDLIRKLLPRWTLSIWVCSRLVLENSTWFERLWCAQRHLSCHSFGSTASNSMHKGLVPCSGKRYSSVQLRHVSNV